MAEAERAPREQEPPAEAPARRAFPLKAALIVLAAFCMQMGVVLLAFQLYRPPPASASAQDADEGQAAGKGASLELVDLGTFNITQFPVGDGLNRHQLCIAMAVAVDKASAETDKKKILDQKAWIGQLVDETIGPLPLDGVHSTNRPPLKGLLKAKINERIGEDVAQEVILRIQAFGP